jgi:hypothetical protein
MVSSLMCKGQNQILTPTTWSLPTLAYKRKLKPLKFHKLLKVHKYIFSLSSLVYLGWLLMMLKGLLYARRPKVFGLSFATLLRYIYSTLGHLGYMFVSVPRDNTS